MSAPAPSRPASHAGVGGSDVALYALTIVVWSGSWIAMSFQVGVVPVAVSVFYRFALSAAIMFAWVLVSRRHFGLPIRLHPRLAAMGVLMFSTNFALFYPATQWITTGVLAVVFSLVTVLNPINAAIFLGEPLDRRVLIGAATGICGVALIFWPEIAGAEFGVDAVKGLALAVCGATSFSLGNIVATTVQRSGYPVVTCNAWGMAYGAAFLALVALVSGAGYTFDPRTPYVASLLYLAVFATVVAFAGYLTLMRRIGPGRAGYATVMFPIGALIISWLFEDYQWTAPSIVGVALAMAGNVAVLRRRRA